MTAERLPFFEARIAGLVRVCCAYRIVTLLVAMLLTIGAGAYASRPDSWVFTLQAQATL